MTVYVLMLLTPTLGWLVAPIEGNPYPTFKSCTLVRNEIIKRKLYRVGGEYFSESRCTPLATK